MTGRWVPDSRSAGVQVYTFSSENETLSSHYSTVSASSQPTPPSSIVGFDTFCAQLAEAAAGACPTEVAEAKEPESTEARLLSRIKQFKVSDDSDDDSYVDSDIGSGSESERSAVPSTPCPSKRKKGHSAVSLKLQSRGRVSHHFRHSLYRGDSVSRPAWLKTSIPGPKKVKKKEKMKTKNQLALDNLRKLERGSPRHIWTPAERTTLCVLHRWYHRSLTSFALVFNQIHSLSLPERRITGQFDSCLRIFGSAYAEYEAVFKEVPFEDPEGVYKDLRRVIEYEARSLGIELQRKEEEESVLGEGKAKKAQAVRTRERYKTLVLKKKEMTRASTVRRSLFGGQAIRASEGHEEVVDAEEPLMLDALAQLQVASAEGPLTTPSSGHPGSTETPSTLTPSEGFLDVEEPLTPTPPFRRSHLHITSPLAFRVWSTSTRAQLTPSGFRSEIFANWSGPIIPLPQSSPFWDVLAANHLSKVSRSGSAFISCAASLLQVLNNDVAKGDGENPQLSVINLAELEERGVVYKASEVIRDLKWGKRQLGWTKYKGLQEYMIWGEIPASAVITTVPLEVLKGSVDASRLLCFDVFSLGTRTRDVVERIKNRGITLGWEEAKSMGEIARLLGLAQRGVVELRHIAALVASVVNGWYVKSDGVPGREVSMAFAMALGSREFDYEDVVEAFEDGLRQGLGHIALYAGRSRRVYQRAE